MTDRTIIIPDLHGALDNGRLALAAVRQPGDMVVQIGDLIHGSAATRKADRAALDALLDGEFDVMLVGNHEYPFVGGSMDFGGYVYDHEIRQKLLAAERAGKLRVALDLDGILVTHAGVTPEWTNRYGWKTSAKAAAGIEALWQENRDLPIFKRVGIARGGFYPEGGILWSDSDEEPRFMGFSQIFGHTAGLDARMERRGGHFALALDSAAGKGGDVVAVAVVTKGDVEIVRVPINREEAA